MTEPRLDIYNADVTATNGRVRMWLRPALYDCPQSWVKFIDALNRRYEQSVGGYSIEKLNQELTLYSGTYVDLGENAEGWVDFATEEDYTYFLMMYS